MKRLLQRSALALPLLLGGLSGCNDKESSGPNDIVFGEPGELAVASGKGSFAFGAATAATQIEDNNTRTDWYYWTMPKSEGGMGAGKGHVGDAVGTYSNPELDIELIKELGLDDYRFSIEWARVEPERGVIDEDALQHYSDFIDALLEAGIRPNISVYHFSNPIWVFGEDMTCPEDGPNNENLCGWDHPDGVEMILESLGAHAKLLAERFGDRVDNWVTLNEPVNYIIASYGAGYFPPGRTYLLDAILKPGAVGEASFEELVKLFRNYLRAHVVIYDAIKAADTTAATEGAEPANVGLTLNVAEWQASRKGKWSDNQDDIDAANRMKYLYHFLFMDALTHGTFDPELSGNGSEAQPDWKGKIDWLGLQYYFRTGVTGAITLIPRLNLMMCFPPYNFGSCVRPEDRTKWVPTMDYEYFEEGLYNIISEFGTRYTEMPIVITEAGIAANNGVRRAENIVRSFEQIDRAIQDGYDVRGYYHWSLTDNFEWHLGFGPHFGLYRVNFDTFERTPSEGATVYRDIIRERRVTSSMRKQYGGVGPMSEETDE